MHPLRLLFAIQSATLGGAPLHAIDLSRRLSARGHDVTLTYRPGADEIRRALGAFPAERVHTVSGYVEMAALIDRLRPQLIQHFDGWSAPGGVELSKQRPRSVQVIHANHALDPASRVIPPHGSDVLVAVSESAARHYPAQPRSLPLRIIWNGIDTRHYIPAPGPPDPVPLRLLSVGRFDETGKRLSVLIDICAGLPRSGWELTLVGDGPDRDRLAQQIRARRVETSVRLEPSCDDPVAHYRAAHVYLSASESEGFGRSLAEAASAGLAIVARRCHGVSELFEDGVHARLSSTDAELAAGLRALLLDAAQRSRLGHAARELAVRRLDVLRMVDEYEGLYRELLGLPQTRRNQSLRALGTSCP